MTYDQFLTYLETSISILTFIVIGFAVLYLIAPKKQEDEHSDTDNSRG